MPDIGRKTKKICGPLSQLVNFSKGAMTHIILHNFIKIQSVNFEIMCDTWSETTIENPEKGILIKNHCIDGAYKNKSQWKRCHILHYIT